MKTIYYTATTLDGFVADDRHSLDWLLQFDNLSQTSYPQFIQHVGALAMGSGTYQWLRGHLLDNDGHMREPWPYQQPTWVFSSRTQPPFPSVEIHFVSGDVRAIHEDISKAASGKNIWIVGGGLLAAQFFDAGLLDVCIFQVAPVLLTSGKPLFPRRLQAKLDVVGSNPIARYFQFLHISPFRRF